MCFNDMIDDTDTTAELFDYDGAFTWKRFLLNWSFVMGNQRSLVDPPHKGPVKRSIDFFCDVRPNKWWNIGVAGDWKLHIGYVMSL